MCGRYVQVASPELLTEWFAVDEVKSDAHEPDYNIAPRQQVYVVREHEEKRVLEDMRWGLIPSWAKDPKIGDRLINARAETVAEKPAYKHAFRRKRCLVPADGFYEWQAVPDQKKKQPMFFHSRGGEPIAFAGLWEVWRDHDDPDAPWIPSCVILTTEANRMMKSIHHRMPVILPESRWATWLDSSVDDPDQLQPLLVPPPEELLEVWPVSTRVNNARNNGADLTDREVPQELFS